MLFGASAVGNTSFPVSLVCDPDRLPDNLALSLLLAHDEISLVNVISIRRDFLAYTMR